tara:strand:- start:742 stop:990 length:249 start_codon:yes stop_codon:yes gene_type:complete
LSYLERLRTIDSVLTEINEYLTDCSHIPGCKVSELSKVITEKFDAWHDWNVLDVLIENRVYFVLTLNRDGTLWIKLRDDDDN